ncbi:MAG: phosphate signaling complex protein PhoU [Oscillospiraceae bacterium]|nr:phosphate signaling complex protein PhoU [Oscillospiraceae bacterium]
MTPRQEYLTQLSLLQEELLRMAAAASDAVKEALQALENRDKEACRAVCAGDRDIDAMERSIEHRCLTMLLRQQPVAKDLRQVSAALKMITDLERIGDAAADIAGIALRLADVPHLTAEIDPLKALAAPARRMVEDAITAYVNGDLGLARATIALDDEVDDGFNALKHALAQRMPMADEDLDLMFDLLMIAKYLERVGDHAVNLCEWAEFCKTGVHKDSLIV